MIITELENEQTKLLLKSLRVQPGTKVYETDTGCRILLSPPFNRAGIGWHLSISHQERYPTWDEIKEARNQLLPMDKTFAMIFPPQEEYVNLHQNTFHLWQVVGKYREIDLLDKEAFA